jgi:peptidylprolyl isomerase
MPAPGTGGPVQAGSTVYFHYVMSADGKVQLDTRMRGPLTHVMGSGKMFGAFERGITGMRPLEKKTVTLTPEEAFGPRDPAAQRRVPRASLHSDSIAVGQILGGTIDGKRVPAVVLEVGEEDVLLDLNHPLAGKSVTFEVEILAVQ